jgi:hypothetical protein
MGATDLLFSDHKTTEHNEHTERRTSEIFTRFPCIPCIPWFIEIHIPEIGSVRLITLRR